MSLILISNLPLICDPSSFCLPVCVRAPNPPPLVQKAVEVMCFVPKRCNDMMNVGRLQGFEVNTVSCSPDLTPPPAFPPSVR